MYVSVGIGAVGNLHPHTWQCKVHSIAIDQPSARSLQATQVQCRPPTAHTGGQTNGVFFAGRERSFLDLYSFVVRFS